MPDWEMFFRLADVALSLAVLVAIIAGFWRGEILSRRVLNDIISRTVHEVMENLRLHE